MSLSQGNVTRTWQATPHGMSYTMRVDLGNRGLLASEVIVSDDAMCLRRGMPAGEIERQLQHQIMQHIRGSLFP